MSPALDPPRREPAAPGDDVAVTCRPTAEGFVCDVRVGSYGHTLGGAVGLAMLDAGDAPLDQDWLDRGRCEIEIAGHRYPALASVKPLFDPAMKRIKS